MPENTIVRIILILLALIGLGVLVETVWGEKLHG